MPSSYSITITDMISRLGADRVTGLTDDQGTGSADSGAVDLAITAAESEFHLYAGVYYQVPLRMVDGVTIPNGIRQKLIEAAAWQLMNRRSEFLRGTSDEGKYWSDRRTEVLAWYAAIASQDMRKRLPISDAVEKDVAVSVDNIGSPRVLSDESLFTRCSMRKF